MGNNLALVFLLIFHWKNGKCGLRKVIGSVMHRTLVWAKYSDKLGFSLTNRRWRSCQN
jgi:hypothetical protein